MLLKTLALGSLLVYAVVAQNDWSKPCFDGECSYDFPSQAGGPQGTLKIWSNNKNAITDITPASGWIILSCDPNALEQNVRLVCQGNESDVNGCGNLFQSLGKSGKIVRLPENCGKNAFGRVVTVSVDQDQSIPQNVASKLATPSGQSPIVRSVAIDVNFKAVDASETGDVNIALEGATYSGAGGTVARRAARSALFDKHIKERGLIDWIDNSFNDFNDFDLSDSTDLTVLDINQSYNLFNFDISCPAGDGWPAFTASATANLQVTANADVTIGVAAVGTIIPPDISQFGLFAALNADFNGQFQLTATASGTADTGLQQLYSVGIPGLDWPGILSIGPVFTVNGQATATLDIDLDVNVDLTYTLTNAKLFFPSSSTQTSGVGVSPGDSALSISVNPNLASNADVRAEVQPRLEVGIDAIAGAASATVFLSMDAVAEATLSLNAAATITTREENTSVQLESRDATGSVNGCADVTASLDMYAGADASFFDLFNPSTTVTLYDGSWTLFSQCWGTSTKRSEIESNIKTREIFPRALACPAGNGQQPLVSLT